MFWRILKTLAFTVVMPGTVGVYVPQALKNNLNNVPPWFAWAGVGLSF